MTKVETAVRGAAHAVVRDATNINYAWTMLAAEECFRLGVRHAVICPGSRSAPLAIAFARHGGITVHVAHDERGGAFLALGIAKSSGVPAVLIVTSGTAVANALPAVVEARLSRTPLLVCAADRPSELRDCGANQAVPQSSLLSAAARWSCEVPCPTIDIRSEYVLSIVDEAFARACGIAGSQGGAVHLNWQFREPLAPDAQPWDVGWLWSIARWTNDSTRAPWRVACAPIAASVVVDQAVVIAGRCDSLTSDSLRDWRGTMLADVSSGLANERNAGADLVLRAAAAANGAHLRDALRVESLAVVGDALVSKRLNAWIAQQEGVTLFGAGDPRNDASHRASGVYAAPVVFEADAKLAPHNGWTRALKTARKAVTKAIASERALTEPTALSDATDACSELAHGTIFYGSSMPIRDADFLALHPAKGWSAGANRGASGIDGLLASAVGHALASRKPVLAVVGDVSMLHDLNSLQLASEVETPLVILVLNNDGGAIFRALPVAKCATVTDELFSQCFTTPHGRAFAPIARAFGLACETPTTRAALSKAMRKALRREGATMIEVVCTPQASEAARARITDASNAALLREFR